MAAANVKAKPAVDIAALQNIAAHNPANTPLPGGLPADPTYLAFLRGIGFTYGEAFQQAQQNIAAAKAQYSTAVQRLPAQLEQGEKAVNDQMLDRGTFDSGERLQKLALEKTADQNRRVDLASQQAQGIAGAQQSLQQKISELARAQADAVGGLQGRRQDQTNQDRYIQAVRAAAQSSGGGGGGGGIALPTPATVAQPGSTPSFRAQRAGEGRASYYNSLDPGGQLQFAAYINSQTPGSTDPTAAVWKWLAADPVAGVSQSARDQRASSSGRRYY